MTLHTSAILSQQRMRKMSLSILDVDSAVNKSRGLLRGPCAMNVVCTYSYCFLGGYIVRGWTWNQGGCNYLCVYLIDRRLTLENRRSLEISASRSY